MTIRPVASHQPGCGHVGRSPLCRGGHRRSRCRRRAATQALRPASTGPLSTATDVPELIWVVEVGGPSLTRARVPGSDEAVPVSGAEAASLIFGAEVRCCSPRSRRSKSRSSPITRAFLRGNVTRPTPARDGSRSASSQKRFRLGSLSSVLYLAPMPTTQIGREILTDTRRNCCSPPVQQIKALVPAFGRVIPGHSALAGVERWSEKPEVVEAHQRMWSPARDNEKGLPASCSRTLGCATDVTEATQAIAERPGSEHRGSWCTHP